MAKILTRVKNGVVMPVKYTSKRAFMEARTHWKGQYEALSTDKLLSCMPGALEKTSVRNNETGGWKYIWRVKWDGRIIIAESRFCRNAIIEAILWNMYLGKLNMADRIQSPRKKRLGNNGGRNNYTRDAG